MAIEAGDFVWYDIRKRQPGKELTMNILKKCIKRLLGIPTDTEEERSAQLIAEIRAGGGVGGKMWIFSAPASTWGSLT